MDAPVSDVADGGGQVEGAAEVKCNFVAPALRVEELKEEDGASPSTGTGTSSDDDAALSVGELSGASDSEAASPKQLPEFQEPDDETVARIVTQVEFYFSDANILKDAFLLKHVRRNKHGFVSLKLVTSFRKMKAITKDYRVVAFSLKTSDRLEVNEEGTKVRRKDPLPEYDETTPSRTVIAVNLPQENPSIESVSQLFSSCGDVALIRILRPGKSIPADVRKHINKHPELGNTMCAVIEFENHDSAKKACETLTDTEDWRNGLRVSLLAPNSKKEKQQKKQKQEALSETDKKVNDEDARAEVPDAKYSKDQSKSPASLDENWRKKDDNNQRKPRNNRFNKLSGKAEASGYLSSGSDIEHDMPRRRHSDDGKKAPFQSRSSLSPKQDSNLLSPNTTPRTTPKSTPKNSPRSSPRSSPSARRRNLGKSPLAQDTLSPGISPRASPAGSPEMQRRKNSGNLDATSSPSHSPWVQRRLKAQETSPLAGNSPAGSPRLGRRLADMEGVVRHPRGPDGSPGFYGGLGRGKPMAVVE